MKKIITFLVITRKRKPWSQTMVEADKKIGEACSAKKQPFRMFFLTLRIVRNKHHRLCLWLLISFLLLLSSNLNAENMKFKKLKLDFRKGNVKTKLRYSLGAGYNIPYKGYDNYLNNSLFSAKFDIIKERDFKREKIAYRLNLDYFMMMVPLDTYGITEDLFNISASFIYGLYQGRKLYPYLGIGAGLYLDWVRINTQILESSNIYKYLGGNAFLGMEIKMFKRLLVIPEVGANMIFSGFPIHLNCTINFAIEPPRKVRRYRKKKRK